jgi:hypothetical protein
MSQFMRPNTDNVGMNPHGVTPLSPAEMKMAYAKLNQAEELKRAQQAAATTPDPKSAGCFLGKVPVRDPRLS